MMIDWNDTSLPQVRQAEREERYDYEIGGCDTDETLDDCIYELAFWGGPAGLEYERDHETFDLARAEAHRVLAEMDNRNAHPAIIYGPGLDEDGVTIR